MIEKEKIEELMSTSTPVEPADDFTARVMATVMETKQGFHHRVWSILASPRRFTLNPVRALHEGVSHDEIFLYFDMVAFAYLILSAVLFLGLKTIDMISLISPLLQVQPWIFLFLACGMGFIGVMARKINIGMQLARVAALIYIEIVVINGALMFMELRLVLFLMPFVATFIVVAAGSGIFLAKMCSIPRNGTRGATTTFT